MALRDLVVSGREAQIMKRNWLLRNALNQARYDLLQIAKEIEAVLKSDTEADTASVSSKRDQ